MKRKSWMRLRTERALYDLKCMITSKWGISSLFLFFSLSALFWEFSNLIQPIAAILPPLMAGIFGISITLPLLFAEFSKYARHVPALFGNIRTKVYVIIVGLVTVALIITDSVVKTYGEFEPMSLVIAGSLTLFLLSIPYVESMRNIVNPFYIIGVYDRLWIVKVLKAWNKEEEKEDYNESALDILESFENFLLQTINLKDYRAFEVGIDQFWGMYGSSTCGNIDLFPSYGFGKEWFEILEEMGLSVVEDPVMLKKFADESVFQIWCHIDDFAENASKKQYLLEHKEAFVKVFTEICQEILNGYKSEHINTFSRPLVNFAISSMDKTSTRSGSAEFVSFSTRVLETLPSDILPRVLPRTLDPFQLKDLKTYHSCSNPITLYEKLKSMVKSQSSAR